MLQRVEMAMERREPSVRELFRTASALAQTFVVRPPSAHAVGLVRQGSGSGRGGSQFRQSQDGTRPQSRSAKGSDAGSRPNSPSADDMA